jgi:hypothetical protein
MRRFVPLMAVTLLGGCGVVPPVVGIASYALDGVSLLASGKTLSDHALSVAVRRDCALLRIAVNREVCADWGTEPQIAAARPFRSPFDRDDPSSDEMEAAGDMPLGPIPAIAERGEPMTLPADLVDVARALPGVAKAEAPPQLATALLPPPKPAAAPSPAATARPGRPVLTALVPSAPAPASRPAVKPDLGAVVRADDAQSRRDAVRAAYEGRYLMVLGSFKGPEMAGRLAKLHPGSKVVRAEAQGEVFYRVVIEPERGARLASKLDDKPWLMPAAKAQPVSIAGTLR